MNVAIGHSEDIDSAGAIEEVLDACAESLNGVVPQAGLLYAAIDHDFQLILDRIMACYPDLELVGCTTDGELSSTTGFAEDSIVLMLFHSDAVRFGAGIGEGVVKDPVGASRQAVAMASAGLAEPVQLCITNPAAIGTYTPAILEALFESLGRNVPVCGGLAGDQFRMEQTYQFYKGSVYTDAIPVLLFAGPMRVSMGVNSGWTPVGGGHRVTRAEGNVVYTIDDKPAADLWVRYFGATDTTTLQHGISVFPYEALDDQLEGVDENGLEGAKKAGDEFYLTAPAKFQEDGSIVVFNPIPSGVVIRFADVTRDQIVGGTTSSVEQACNGYSGSHPDAALVYSCAARRIILGTRVVEESELLQAQFGSSVPIIGFYTYAEFCPLPSSLMPQVHGGTFVTVLIGEG